MHKLKDLNNNKQNKNKKQTNLSHQITCQDCLPSIPAKTTATKRPLAYLSNQSNSNHHSLHQYTARFS